MPELSPLEILKEDLSKYDELTILELLDITSEELVEALTDIIEEKYYELRRKLNDNIEEE